MSAFEEERSRFRKLGAGSLAPIELLALLPDHGAKEEGSLNPPRGPLKRLKGIRRLGDLARANLSSLRASLASGERMLVAMGLDWQVFQAGLCERTEIRGPEHGVREFSHLRDERRERVCATLLVSKWHMLQTRAVSIGALNLAMVQPRDVSRKAVREGAASVTVLHNQPSGDLETSADDAAVTLRRVEAGRFWGVSLLEHVILGVKRFVRLHERGVL